MYVVLGTLGASRGSITLMGFFGFAVIWNFVLNITLILTITVWSPEVFSANDRSLVGFGKEFIIAHNINSFLLYFAERGYLCNITLRG